MYLREAQTQTLREIPDGTAGIRATLAYMEAYVREYKKDEEIRGMALELTMHLPQKDFAGEVREIFSFVQSQVRYVYDIADVETLQTPPVTLHTRAGDCDDKSTLLAAMLESIGHKTRFVACGFSPGQIEHVYVETKIGERWVALDATEPNAMGWQPPYVGNPIIRHN